jgi:hypothetical protein
VQAAAPRAELIVNIYSLYPCLTRVLPLRVPGPRAGAAAGNQGRGTGDGEHMQALGLAKSNDASVKALNYILEAWEEGTESGIAPELMAYAAIYTALTDLVAAFGEESVITLVNSLVPRVQNGEFTIYRTRQ